MLVLLIIFMITAPLLTPGIEVNLPEVGAESISQNEEPITLYVNAQGQYFLDIGANQDSPLVEAQVITSISAVLANKPGTMILVKGDKNASYNSVALGMGALQAAGAKSIGFVTEPGSASSK